MDKSLKFNEIKNKMFLKLVVPNKHDSDDKIKRMTILNNPYYKFYLQERNMTPEEPMNIKYFKLEIEQWTNLLLEKDNQIHIVDENYTDFYLHMNVQSIKNLLTDVFGGLEDLNKNKYDVGLNIPHSRENIITQRYEIELSESQTYLILDLTSSVTIKGDGDYERIQEMKYIYLNNCMKSHVKIDNIAQTINSFMDHENEECQTISPSYSTVGTQVHDFNIIDTQNGVDNEQNLYYVDLKVPLLTEILNYDQVQKDPQILVKDTDIFFEKAMIMERILIQNTLNANLLELSQITNETENLLLKTICILTYCNITKNLAVKCMHWNETKTNLLAVAYSKLIYYDYENKPTAVAIWNMKNTYSPERFYEFEESDITCLKFSTENPNLLAMGFYCGEIIIIDITSRYQNIIFQKSKQLLFEINGITDLFWTIRIETTFPIINQYECLMTCSLNGRIARYRYLHGTFAEKIIMQLSHCDSLIEAGNHKNNSEAKKNSTSICSATQFIGLNPNKYLVGTRDGSIYTCAYDNSLKYLTKIMAHYGIIKSLEKSPYCRDIYLTTGCDCKIKIWISDIFIEPIITLHSKKQIEKAIWSRSSSTVIISIIERYIYIWDIYKSQNEAISIYKDDNFTGNFSAIEFTLDGKYLCISDINGNVIVYNWIESLIEQIQENNNLMYCIANIVYNQEYLYKTLCKELPEYINVFSRLNDERQMIYLS